MAKACIFCGDTSTPLTREHIFGDWISRFFADEHGGKINGIVELVNSSGDITAAFKKAPFQHTAKIVCHNCNHGWMGELETSVMDDLKPMMQGKPKMMRANAQKRVAFWCVKTALVLDYLHPDARVIPNSHYTDLYNLKSPLPGQVVLTGYRTVTSSGPNALLGGAIMGPVYNFQPPDGWTASDTEKIQDQLKSGRKLYKIVFTVGNFVALVFGHDLPIGLRIETPKPIARSIWPLNRRFRWSDELSIDRIGGLQGFYFGFAPGSQRRIELPPHLAKGMNAPSQ